MNSSPPADPHPTACSTAACETCRFSSPDASDQPIVTPSRIKRLRKCVETIECYGHFHEGQDGFQALLEMRQFVDDLEGKLSPYGYCPHCSKPGIERESEDLTKAAHSMQFAVGSLQDALKQATAVEALLLLEMIETGAKLQQRIETLAAAKESA